MLTLLQSSNREIDPEIRPGGFSPSTPETLLAIEDTSEPGELNILRTNRLNPHAIRFSQMNVEHHQNAVAE